MTICDGTKCIAHSEVCNGYPDCKDLSDESNCDSKYFDALVFGPMFMCFLLTCSVQTNVHVFC